MKSVANEKPREPGKRRYSYDPACEDLARFFLHALGVFTSDETLDVKELSQDIQDAIDNYFAGKSEEPNAQR